MSDQSPIARFLSHASAHSTEPAFVGPELTLRFGELADIVSRMANRFRQHGVSRGSSVGIVARPEVEASATLAVLSLGGVSMSRPATGWTSMRDAIDFLIVNEVETGFPLSRQIVVDSQFVADLGAIAPLDTPILLDDDELCRVVFSSGTTGVPKGVPFTAGIVTARIASAEENWMRQKPFMALLGLDTVSGYQTFMWAMVNGSTYFSPQGPTHTLGMLKRYGIASIKTSPAKLKDLSLAARNQGTQLTQLREIQVAGSLLTPQLAHHVKETFGITPTYLYGSSEVGTVTRGIFDPDSPRRVGTIVSDVELEIVTDSGEMCSPGEVGWVRCRRESLPPHYWLDVSGSGFVNGWFYPGDLGSVSSDGVLTLEGRGDDLVNAGGTKLNLSHLDEALLTSELFDDVATFTTTDEFGETRIGLGFVESREVSSTLLIERVSTLFPHVSFAIFLRLDALPRNALGKINRRELAAKAR